MKKTIPKLISKLPNNPKCPPLKDISFAAKRNASRAINKLTKLRIGYYIYLLLSKKNDPVLAE